MSFSLAASLMLAMVVMTLAPQQLGVTIYKLSLVTAGGVAGYWLDRELFPYARPDIFEVGGRDLVFAAAQIRRAIIVGCLMLAVGLGA